MTNSFTPKLEWPEMAAPGEREAFYQSFINELGGVDWVAVVMNPTPFDGNREAIESECRNLLTPIELQNNGLAWLCSNKDLLSVLPVLFQALKPELVFLTFYDAPGPSEITHALQSDSADPAQSIFYFDEGALVEVRR